MKTKRPRFLQTQIALDTYAADGPPSPSNMPSIVSALLWDRRHAQAERLADKMHAWYLGHRGFYGGDGRLDNRIDYWLGVYDVLSNQTSMRSTRAA